MKTTLLTIALAAAFAASAAHARESDLEALARDAGLTDREMRMLMGAPTGYAEYRTSYAQIRDKLRRAEAAQWADEADYDTREPAREPRHATARPAATSERAAPAEAETYPLDEPQ